MNQLPSFYLPIVHFLFTCRLATATQIQQRFSQFLSSARSTRRHLQKLVQLNYIDYFRSSQCSPHIYFPRPKGLRALQKLYVDGGVHWQLPSYDQTRERGRTNYHLNHELFVTEFQILIWQLAQETEHLRLHWCERRYAANPLIFLHSGKEQTLIPDLGCLVSITNRDGAIGHIHSFAEIDCGTESITKISRKYQAYARWASSTQGQSYLEEVYRQHGAKEPRPHFRLLVILHAPTPEQDHRRLVTLLLPALDLATELQARMWFCDFCKLQADGDNVPLSKPVWLNLSDCQSWLPQYRNLAASRPRHSKAKLQVLRRRFVAERLNNITRRPLFPAS